ncbi:MAG: type secretion system protein VirD4, partial [Actinomycetota bacterium]|nr:type secretion system protein VirD4 [Actinomycetota bacterium]
MRIPGWLRAVVLAVGVVALLRAPVLVAVGAGVPVVLVWWQRWHRTAATVNRWGRRSRRKSGVASTLDLLRVGSWLALRRQATT